VTFGPSIEAGSSAMIRAKMNWSLVIGPIVFLVVFAAVRGAFPRAKRKPPESNFVALPNRGGSDIDHANVPEFEPSWKDAR
jgi:hypothetical protein